MPPNDQLPSLGGFQPFTLSDYPGRPAAMLYTRGCNLRCPFCHNGGLLEQPTADVEDVPYSHVLNLLTERRGKLTGVVISGGEPTIHPGLPALCRRLKDLGYAVKLDTNGTRPAALRNLLAENLLDFVAQDIKGPLERYDEFCGRSVERAAVLESIDLVASSGLPHLFRTTLVEPLLRPGDRERIAALVPPGSRHVWQRFNPARALDPVLRG